MRKRREILFDRLAGDKLRRERERLREEGRQDAAEHCDLPVNWRPTARRSLSLSLSHLTQASGEETAQETAWLSERVRGSEKDGTRVRE